MSSELFAGLPSVNIPRSRWKNGYDLPMTFKHGKLIPMDAIPVLPGDGCHMKLKDLTWMQTPIAPIFGNIKQHWAAFFVPMRLVWNHTEEFFGANKTTAGPQTTAYKILYAVFNNGVNVGSPSHYLGKPLCASTDVDEDSNKLTANILKERCYFIIYNEYFRASQVTNPVLLDTSDSNGSNVSSKIGTFRGSQIDPGAVSSLMTVAKEFDYFTASTISPQYGAAVELPLGTEAPLKLASGTHQTLIKTAAGTSITGASQQPLGYDSGIATNSWLINNNDNDANPLRIDLNGGMVADLSTATAAKVNDLRYAFAVQKYLERANFSGNYFFGILQVHYGITSPDSRLQRPEFLGEFTTDILINQVIATADTTNDGKFTPVGNAGAKSCTYSGEFSLFDKAFVEPGFLVLLKWTKHRQLYAGGIMREDMKRDRFEVYTPELCNLGDQSTKTKELYWKASDSDIFGYQEHWAEYRYRPDRASGLLDPYAASGLPYWTLAHKFTAKPQLNNDFIFESRVDLDRALVTGSSIDEFISDTWIQITWTREMPIRTMPGLIDHYGAW